MNSHNGRTTKRTVLRTLDDLMRSAPPIPTIKVQVGTTTYTVPHTKAYLESFSGKLAKLPQVCFAVRKTSDVSDKKES